MKMKIFSVLYAKRLLKHAPRNKNTKKRLLRRVALLNAGNVQKYATKSQNLSNTLTVFMLRKNSNVSMKIAVGVSRRLKVCRSITGLILAKDLFNAISAIKNLGRIPLCTIINEMSTRKIFRKIFAFNY